jgi:cytochrome-b5 reductase
MLSAECRLAHSLKEGDPVEVRGPIPTFSITPGQYDRIVMISTGTGIAPFLQLLSRIPSSTSSVDARSPAAGPRFELVHLQAGEGKEDWAVSGGMIPRLQAKFGGRLTVHRPPATLLSGGTIKTALGVEKDLAKNERVVVLVCLPPQ